MTGHSTRLFHEYGRGSCIRRRIRRRRWRRVGSRPPGALGGRRRGVRGGGRFAVLDGTGLAKRGIELSANPSRVRTSPSRVRTVLEPGRRSGRELGPGYRPGEPRNGRGGTSVAAFIRPAVRQYRHTRARPPGAPVHRYSSPYQTNNRTHGDVWRPRRNAIAWPHPSTRRPSRCGC